jgi:vacuolar-type H+-ATPase subunit F/Vma7
MPVPEFIGDEVSAAGYRLAGLNVTIIEDAISAERLVSMIRQACTRTSLVLIGSDIADRLPQAELETLLAGIEPSLVVVPDIRCRAPTPDLAARLHKQLGMLE